MKRAASEVALKTVLYAVGGLQKIRIVDYPNLDSKAYGVDGREVFSGLSKDLILKLDIRQEKAKIYGIAAVGDVLEISICTAFDTF